MRSKNAFARVCAVIALLAAACSTPPERLTLEGRTITIFNDSADAWKAVEIWVNDHYRVTRDTMAPGERFVVPLESFVAGFGQRFRRDQHVTGIEVTATDASGKPVRLVWGTGRRR
jgi:putative intracellular protease/amidase